MGTSDFYCSDWTGTILIGGQPETMDVPTSTATSYLEDPTTGTTGAYCGIITTTGSGTSRREYLSQNMSSPMVPNQRYKYGFQAALASTSAYATSLGIQFIPDASYACQNLNWNPLSTTIGQSVRDKQLGWIGCR
jgi:hypothetical protein